MWASGKFSNIKEEESNRTEDIKAEEKKKGETIEYGNGEKYSGCGCVVGLIIFLIIGVIIFAAISGPKTDIQIVKSIGVKSEKELKKGELSEFRSAVKNILTDKDSGEINQLMKLVYNNQINDDFKVIVLQSILKENIREINSAKIMDLAKIKNSKIQKEVGVILSRNNPDKNEEIFLKLAEEYKNDEEALLDIYMVYSDIGNSKKDKIYKLNISVDALIDAYTKRGLKKEELQNFLAEKDKEERNRAYIKLGDKVLQVKSQTKMKEFKEMVSGLELTNSEKEEMDAIMKKINRLVKD